MERRRLRRHRAADHAEIRIPRAPGPYDIDHVSIDSYALYTNLPPAGALRGFGIPQLVWAYESHTDLIARELKIDPLAFRLKNILRDGRPQATGTLMKDAAIERVLERLAARMDWHGPFDRGSGPVRRGRGMAVGFKASISPTTSIAIVSVNADGSCSLACSTVDMGQGSDTANAQIVADVLDLPLDSITVVHPDTDVTPYDMATLGSRSMYHMGNAVKLAAEDARDKLLALAAELGLPGAPAANLFQKKYGMQAGNVVGIGSFIPKYTPPDYATGLTPNATPFWMIGATGAEVEVDTETGHVKVTRLINVADVGRPINPAIVETQLSGGSIMQLGFTLFERMDFDAGQATNASLADYKIPGMLDARRRNGERSRPGRAARRALRRERRRRDRDLRRVARDRQRDPRRRGRALDFAAVDRGGRLSRAARRPGRAAGGGSVSDISVATRKIRFTLNGERVTAAIASHQNLVELLQQFDLFGARESCGQGLCGCCTVLVNGTAVSGCLFLAAFVDGAEVETVEGPARRPDAGLRAGQDAGGGLDAVQEALIETGGFQCGFCTPGFIIMIRQLLAETPDPDEDEIRHYLSGNLCRCAAYPEIVAAVKVAARWMQDRRLSPFIGKVTGSE